MKEMNTEKMSIDSQYRQQGRLNLLDYTRFLAALMVIIFHWGYNGIRNGKISSIDTFLPFAHWATMGYLGVHIFFMISGYVIAKSYQNKTAIEFAVGRFFRLYPSYWVALTITTIVTLLWGYKNGLEVYPLQFLANLTMVSNLIGSTYVDGVYWTLEYELLFYILIFILMLVGLKKYIFIFCIIWSLILSAIFFIGGPTPHHTYLDYYFTYFLTGMLISRYAQNRNIWILPVLGLSWVTNMGYAYKGVPQHIIEFNYYDSRLVAAVIIAAAGILIFSMSSIRVANASLPHATFLGSLTYPIYLLHAHIGYILLSVFASDENRIVPYLLIGIVIFFMAWLLHELVEVRLVPKMRRGIKRNF